jgi:hypothetical protein
VGGWRASEVRHNAPHLAERIVVIIRKVIGNTTYPAVHIGASELLCRNLNARRGFHQWGTAQEYGALLSHNHCLVAHGRDIRAPGGTGTEHRGDLGNTDSAHTGLIIKYPTEVIAVREHLILQGKKCTA